MNVLTYVMVMIMLMATMTYSRWHSYTSNAAVLNAFQVFLEKGERSQLQVAMKKKYDNIIVQTSDRENPEKPESSKGSKTLNIRVLLTPSLREKEPQRYEIYSQLFKQLVRDLYSNHPYFQELEKERPAYLDELLSALANIGEQQKLNKKGQLDNIKLEDPVLNELLYRLLKVQPKGPSLKDYITIQPQDNIRVYLAPKELLQVIFQDTNVVETIMEERLELFRQLDRKNPISKEEATKQFQELLKRYPTQATPFLEAQVTKSDPRG